MTGDSHINPGKDSRPRTGARTPPAGWTIDVLFYGQITGPAKMILEGLDEETFTNPYLGFLLRDGTRCVLVDCGISDRFIVDGKTHAVRTNVEQYGPAIPFLVYDYYAWYDSVHKAKALARSKPEFVLPGHEPSLVTDFRR